VVHWDLEGRASVLRYGFSVVCVAIALGLSLAMQYYQLRDAELPIFCLSIAVATWGAGIGPSVLAIVLSTACFNYFFTEPLYSFEISGRDQPFFLVFIAWAVIVAWFAATQRAIERNLRQARDRLQVEVEQRRHREEEVRKLNLELAKRATELEASNKELDSFAYSVSHDLRAPLRHIGGYAELLQKQASSLLDDKSHRYVQTILESSKRMGNLIDDLLAFSRIGRAEARKTVVDLEQLVKEVVADLRQETAGRDIAWKIGALPACFTPKFMIELLLRSDLAVEFTEFKIVLPRAAVFLAGSHPVGLSLRWPECPLLG
jgi:K+-sensing histidine kinase KdpD